jgi:esterase/lipase
VAKLEALNEFKADLTVGGEVCRFFFKFPEGSEEAKKIENKFEDMKAKVKKRKVQNNSLAARVWLFDQIFDRIENITNPKAGLVGPDDKKITKNNLHHISRKFKSELIFLAYEDTGVSSADAEDGEEEEKN